MVFAPGAEDICYIANLDVLPKMQNVINVPKRDTSIYV